MLVNIFVLTFSFLFLYFLFLFQYIFASKKQNVCVMFVIFSICFVVSKKQKARVFV